MKIEIQINIFELRAIFIHTLHESLKSTNYFGKL